MIRRTLSVAIAALALVAVTGCPSEGGAAPKPAAAKQPTDDGKTGKKPDPEEAAKPKKPAPAPEPEFVFDRATAKNPWVRAKVGDWIKLETPAGTMKFEVSAVEEATVKFKIFSVDGAEETLRREADVDLAKEEEGYKDPRTYDAVTEKKDGVKLEVAGKQLDCFYIKREHGGMSTETWVCDEIALNGSVVKSIKDGSVNVLLLDFGSKE